MTGCAHWEMMVQPRMPKQQTDASNFMARFSATGYGVQF
jgi:hypothetical protein